MLFFDPAEFDLAFALDFAVVLASGFELLAACAIREATLASAVGVPSAEIAETTCFCSSAKRLNADSRRARD